MSTKNRVAIVTGGATGIGYAFVQGLLAHDYGVVIADLRGAEAAAQSLRGEGADVIGVTADVADRAQAEAMVRSAVDHFGGLDVLVNNAGIFTNLKMTPVEKIDDAEWDRVMRVNVFGPFNCARAALPALRQRGGGRIVNIASIVALKGPPMMPHYVASKGAVIALTRALAREFGALGITVNSIAPGLTLSDGVLETGIHETFGDVARRTGRSIQRDQVPQDLVGAMLFLAGADSAFITGQTLVVDGGSVFV